VWGTACISHPLVIQFRIPLSTTSKINVLLVKKMAYNSLF